MSKRPKSVTFISWLNIIFGFLRIFSVPILLSGPIFSKNLAENNISTHSQLLQICISSTIVIISGLFMLGGANWARILHVIHRVIGITVQIFQGSTAEETFPQILYFVITAALLFRTKSNEFFGS